jgi:hypothetical protein
MKQLVVWLTLIISVLILPAAQAQDTPILSDDPPYPCPNANGAYYQAGVFPRFDAATRSLVLVDANGATIRTLDHIEQNVRIINWSPDCRYLTGALGVIGRYESGESRSSGEDYVNWDSRQELVIWDVYSGQRLTSLVRAGGGSFLPSNLVRWSPQSDRALIATAYYGHFLWRADSQAVTELERADLGGWYRGYSMNQLYWDTSRQWLWSTATGNVVTFDMESGLVQAVFSVCPNNTPADCWGETRFGFSPDSAKLIVYSLNAPRMDWGSITIHDLTTREAMTVNTEGFAAPHIPYSTTYPVALSADNRYLIAGYDAIRVWDIQNLPATFEERLPIYRHAGPEATIDSLRFADWGIIETTSAEGVQRWDLHTGAYIE